jgi:hypothetical protein
VEVLSNLNHLRLEILGDPIGELFARVGQVRQNRLHDRSVEDPIDSRLDGV